ncbi:unnamed protein product [Orchesella dallaii]|uniref:Uncharacterized protein n=1 Tax=Orchesella dallaii TaxID=48710 RepID=A0ABP1RD16_9HEXA
MNPSTGEDFYYNIDNLLLISSQFLRSKFALRWKQETGKSWGSEEGQGQQVIEGLGKRVRKSLQVGQKVKIEEGCLEDWDLSTLSLVLQHFVRNSKMKKIEIEAIKSLTRLKNDLAQNSKKKLSRQEFNEKLGQFKTSLRELSCEEEEIRKIIECAGITSSALALEITQQLYEKAEAHLNKGESYKALKSLGKATTTPSLLPVNQAAAFVKRAECYINLARKQGQAGEVKYDDKLLQKAAFDALNALELDKYCWKAHKIVAQWHHKQSNWEEASIYLEQAIKHAPFELQSHLKDDLKSCKILSGEKELTTEVESVKSLPPNPFKFTEEEFNTEKEGLGRVLPQLQGQEDVFQGHQYIAGWSVAQNDSEAFQHYEKAAEVGNPEGIYHLGYCYHHGRGVEQDLEKAHQLYLEAGSKSSKIVGLTNKFRRNLGVVNAQHALGLLYENGLPVEQDYEKAAEWFKKASENGVAESATCLGYLYRDGKGVPQDEKWAMVYWEDGLMLGDPKAAKALMHHYIEKLEGGKARAMLEKGRKMDSSLFQDVTDEDFKLLLESCPEKSVKEDKSEEVLPFEEERMLNLVECKKEDEKIVQLGNFSDAERVDDILKDIRRLTQIFLQKRRPFSESEKTEIVEIMYKGAQEEYDAFNLHPSIYDALKTFLRQLANAKCGKKVKASEQEMKIRFAYITFNLREQKCAKEERSLFKMAKKGLQMYPENAHYHWLVSKMHGPMDEPLEGLRSAEQALEKFPNHSGLRNVKAACLARLLGYSEEETHKYIKAYKDYLQLIPFDHWKIPQVNYLMAHRWIPVAEKYSGSLSEVGKKVKYYYDLAIESEMRVHSYFRSQIVPPSSCRSVVEKFLSKVESILLSETEKECCTAQNSDEDQNFEILPQKSKKENGKVEQDLVLNDSIYLSTELELGISEDAGSSPLPMLNELQELGQNDLQEENVSPPNLQQQSSNEKVFSASVKFPLFCIAIFCFVQGHFFLSLCMILYLFFDHCPAPSN